MNIKNIFKKQITYKFYLTSILIVFIFFLKVLDMSLTLIALNLEGYGFEEANPFAYFFVENPKTWLIMNFIMVGIFALINVVLWFMDKKTEITIDKVTFIFDIMLIITTILSIWVVCNNMYLFYVALH